MIRKIRQSEIKAFKRCRRKWMLSYLRNLERIQYDEHEETARIGTEVHAVLDSYYRGGAMPLLDDSTLPGIMVEGYLDWLSETGADAGLKVVYSEERIEHPFGTFHGDEVILTGKLDLVVHDEATGLNLLLDHKTVQSLDQAGEQLKVDDQLQTYVLLLRARGVEVDGALHNMLRRVKRTAKATPPFYGRRIVRFNEEQLENHEMHLRATLAEMVRQAQAIEGGVDHHLTAYPNPTKDCTWDCPFLAVCPMMDDGSDWEGFLSQEYRIRKEAV